MLTHKYIILILLLFDSVIKTCNDNILYWFLIVFPIGSTYQANKNPSTRPWRAPSSSSSNCICNSNCQTNNSRTSFSLPFGLFSEPPENTRKEILLILIPAITIPLIVACLFFLVCMCRNKQKATSDTPPRCQISSPPNQDVELSLLNQQKHQVHTQENTH